MARYKYLRGGRVFESDKKYNLPQIGVDGKLITPTKKITDPKVDPKVPTFKNQKEHDDYYTTQLLEKNKGTGFYNEYHKFIQAGDIASAQAQLAAMGGLPKYNAPVTGTASGSFSGANSRVKNVGFKPQPTEGYQYNKGLPDKESITKRKFNTGGFVEKETKKNPFSKPPVVTGVGSGPIPSSSITSSSTTSPATSKASGFTSILGSTAPFFDNIANLVATNKTPNIPQPILTNAPRLATKLNINPQKRRIEDDTKAAGMGIDRSTSSAGVANANKGSLLANKFRAIGDLEANKQNFETEQGNRQAYMDFQAQSNNNQLLNQRNSMQMMRTDDVNSRYASVVSDFGSDIANINREKNMMNRDKDAFRTLMKVSPDAAYQFADTDMFSELYRNDEPGLRKLILSNQGTAQRAKLTAAYKRLFNRDFTD